MKFTSLELSNHVALRCTGGWIQLKLGCSSTGAKLPASVMFLTLYVWKQSIAEFEPQGGATYQLQGDWHWTKPNIIVNKIPWLPPRLTSRCFSFSDLEFFERFHGGPVALVADKPISLHTFKVTWIWPAELACKCVDHVLKFFCPIDVDFLKQDSRFCGSEWLPVSWVLAVLFQLG